MKRFLSTMFGLALLCMFAEAQAVPGTMSFTGRLSTSNGPVTGNVNVVFTLYDASTGGSSQWTETHNGLSANNGLVYASLGSLTTLDGSVFDGGNLYLEIVVAGETLSPRLPIGSVPYAFRSEIADTADTLGTITPGQVVTTVNASGGISAARSGNTVTLTGTAITGTAPIAVAGGAVSLTTCSANQIYKMTGGVWQCAADANTVYTAAANGGINVSGTTVGLTNCAVGQVLKSTGTNTWSCQADADSGGDITGITTAAGSGLDGGCATGTCTLTLDPTDFNAVPVRGGTTSNGTAPADSPGWASTLSQSITAPGVAGRVVAIGSTEFRCSNTSTTNTSCALLEGLNTSVAAPAVYSRSFYTSDVGLNYSHTTVYSVFSVAAGSTTTVHLLLQNETAGDSWIIYAPRLLLFFVPN